MSDNSLSTADIEKIDKLVEAGPIRRARKAEQPITVLEFLKGELPSILDSLKEGVEDGTIDRSEAEWTAKDATSFVHKFLDVDQLVDENFDLIFHTKEEWVEIRNDLTAAMMTRALINQLGLGELFPAE